MNATYKKLVTDIGRGANLSEKIPEHAALLEQQYNCYATVKGSMNLYTMKEICDEQEDANTDICRYFKILTGLLQRHINRREPVDEASMEAIAQLRENVEYKMHILTAYTDAYEIYEYILNRVEAAVHGEVKSVDVSDLADRMFAYVFSENDTVVINSKLQLLMAQLPVRMTKSKFFDIVNSTLHIYEGGECTSVDEFTDMLRSTVLLKKPKGFETEYPYLFHVYTDLAKADYRDMSGEEFDDLTGRLNRATHIINNEVSAYMLFAEVVNDVYAMLLTVDDAYEKNTEAVPGYAAAVRIIKSCAEAETVEKIPDEIMDEFFTVEGVQERIYETIMILETVSDDIRVGKAELVSALSLTDRYERLDRVSKLLSTSMFIDLDQKQAAPQMADHAYIEQKKTALVGELTELFASVKKPVSRSMMSKLLAAMPIFLNSQQEIRDYFNYVLDNCRDDSELAACSELIHDIIDEE